MYSCEESVSYSDFTVHYLGISYTVDGMLCLE